MELAGLFSANSVEENQKISYGGPDTKKSLYLRFMFSVAVIGQEDNGHKVTAPM